MPSLRIVLVDDNSEFLKSARGLLSLNPCLNIIGTAASGIEAIDKINRLRPDLALIDWAMPGMTGLETMRFLKARLSAPKIVLLTFHDIPLYRTAALAAGADGFLNKADWTSALSPLLRDLFPDWTEEIERRPG